MAFIEGQYSKGFPAGGMISYVMDGKCDKAWNGLEERIESQREPLKLIADSRLAKSKLSRAVAKGVDGTHLGETEHDPTRHTSACVFFTFCSRVNGDYRAGLSTKRASENRQKP